MNPKPAKTIVDSTLEAFLREAVAGKRTVMICIGNRLRGDDSLGPLVAEKLSGRLANIKVIYCKTTPENYILDIIALRPDVVLMVNAVDEGRMPGTVVHRDITTESLGPRAVTAHTIPLTDVAHLIRSLSPNKKVHAYMLGVQARSVEHLSNEVRESAEKISRILQLVDHLALSLENSIKATSQVSS